MCVRETNEKWITEDYFSTAHDRDYFSDKYRKTHIQLYKTQHRIFRNRANIMARKLKRDYIQSELDLNRGKLDALWKTLKELIPSTKNSGPVLSKDPNMSNKDIANNFNQAFCNMGQDLAKTIPPPSQGYVPPHISRGPVPFELGLLSVQYVVESIKTLPLHKATGLDGINTRMLRCAANAIPLVLTCLFNKTITNTKIPAQWKAALVMPIFKDGDKSEATNYRPISVFPITMKILERHVHNLLYNFITEHGLLCREQTGFRKQHSTASATLDILDDLYWSIDGG